MKSFALVFSAIVNLCLLSSAQTATKPAVIEAAKFASLQAAFDAVPTNGGVVLLLPGTFELVLR